MSQKVLYLLAIRKTQIKPLLRCHFAEVRITKRKKSNDNEYWCECTTYMQDCKLVRPLQKSKERTLKPGYQYQVLSPNNMHMCNTKWTQKVVVYVWIYVTMIIKETEEKSNEQFDT